MVESDHFSRTTFAATGFMTALPEDVHRRLLNHGLVRQFAKGELIQQRGDPGKEFWHIRSGNVQIGRYSFDGKLSIFAVLGPGESFGEQAFLGEFPRMVDAIAGNDVTLVRIGEKELQEAITSDPRVARILLKTMAHMVQQAFDLVNAGRNLSTVERVARALLGLCEGEGHTVSISITQQELADLVGVSRVSLGKALGKLEQSGNIERNYGEIVVLNPLLSRRRHHSATL